MCHRVLLDQDDDDNPRTRFPPDLIRPLVSRCLKFVKQNSAGSAAVSTDIARASMDLLGTLLQRDPKEKIFHQDDVKLLIRMARLDLDDPSRLPGALKLLKCIFDRKSLLPEMYDVALKLTELLFQAAKDRDRIKCGELVSQFLMDYPLEEKRVQQQLDLVVKNLDYPYEDGRLAGLNMLKICIDKFPRELVDESAEFFFLPVVLRLVNDDSPAVKEKAAKVCLALLQKVQEKKLQRLTEMVIGWFARPASLSAACQAAGLLVDSGKLSPKSQTFGLITDKLVETIRDEEQDDDQWEIVYGAMTSFELVLKRDPQRMSLLDDVLTRLMVHAHAWIRLVAGRFLSLTLTQIMEAPEDEEKKGKKSKQQTAPKRNFKGFDVVLALVDQLDADVVSDELAQLVTGNFLTMVKLAKARPGLFYSVDDQQAEDGGGKDPVAWIAKRLGLIASRPEREHLDLKNRRRRAVFNIYLAMCDPDEPSLDPSDDDTFRAMVKAAMIIHVPDPRAVDPLKELCDQVLEAVKAVIGAERFVQVVNDIRNVRLERKRDKQKALVLSKVLPLPERELFPKRQKAEEEDEDE